MIFNIIGAIMLIAGLVAGFAVGGIISLISKSDDLPMSLGFLAVIVISAGSDLWFRHKYNRERGRLRYLHPVTGGMFFLLPVWLFLALPFGFLVVVQIGKKLGMA